jgi:hypothetical protein
MLFAGLNAFGLPAAMLFVLAAQFTGGFFGTQMHVASHFVFGSTAAQSSLHTIFFGSNILIPAHAAIMLFPEQLSVSGPGGTLHMHDLASQNAAGLTRAQSSLHRTALELNGR